VEPRLSRPATLLALDGETLTNLDSNIASVIHDEVTIRSTESVVPGSFWEWHAPLGLSQIELGVCSATLENEPLNYELMEFNSSTARTVTFGLSEGTLQVWVNGTKPNKKSSRNVSCDRSKEKLFPCAKLKGKGNTIVFSPFLTTSVSSISSYNLFGDALLQPPEEPKETAVEPSNNKLTKLVQLSPDRMLLVWQDNRIQLLVRNK
jgi:hypothetical protein